MDEKQHGPLTLKEAEQRALADYIGENFAEFQRVAGRYLSEDETDQLYEKLSGEAP